jgi:hypothetical protein
MRRVIGPPSEIFAWLFGGPLTLGELSNNSFVLKDVGEMTVTALRDGLEKLCAAGIKAGAQMDVCGKLKLVRFKMQRSGLSS